MRFDVFGFFLVAFGAVTAACSTTSSVPSDAGVDAALVINDANEIPCGPRLVLQTVCQQCHTRPPRNSAPFPLVNRSDVLALRSKSVIRQLMIDQLEARRMPLKPVTIDEDSRTILLDWLKAGAPAIPPQSCQDAGVVDAGEEASVVDSGDDSGDDSGIDDAGSDAPVDAADD